MRRGRDNGILKTEDGTVIGINLGADYCSEHEWGIKGLKEMFGISDTRSFLGIKQTVYGIDRRRVTKLPVKEAWGSLEKVSCARLIDTKKETILLVGHYVNDETYDLKNTEIKRDKYHGEELLTAWNEKSFGINAASEEDRAVVRELYNALLEKELVIWLGGGGVFQNAGLVVAKASKIPLDRAEILKAADIDREQLEKAAEQTGIADKLAKAKLRYFALSPKWATSLKSTKDGDIITDYSVVFWLNPMEQDRNNYGWFTVEQLLQWTEGTGPIPKKGDAA